jgi:hypothetical protein
MAFSFRAVPPFTGWAALVLCAAFACSPRHAREAAQPLDGLDLPLTSSGVRAEVDGEVAGLEATVVLDVAQPITLVSTGCFGQELPKTATFVRYLEPGGELREAPEISLLRARVGDRRLGSRRVALYEDDERCMLVVGNDVLAPYALEVDPSTRRIRITRSRPRADYAAVALAAAGQPGQGLEHHLLDLVRDPKNDWPLLGVRMRQDRAVLTGTFVLSTGQSETVVGQAQARSVGLRPGPDFVRELGVPDDIALPKNLGGNTYSLDRLELSPGFGVRFVGVQALDEWKGEGIIGVVGGDVWGRFIAVIDAAAGVLVLKRPRVFASGDRQRCAGQGGPSEEACFVLHQEDVEGGVDLVATLWRELPRGARVYLDVLDAQGQALSTTCRVGLSFGRSDRGITAAHRIPWQGLTRSLPSCADQLSSAAQVRFSLWEEEAHDACPGNCAFVQDSLSYRVSCECQGGALAGMGEAERKFIEMYRGIMKRRGPADAEDADPEPEDPE